MPDSLIVYELQSLQACHHLEEGHPRSATCLPAGALWLLQWISSQALLVREVMPF